MVANHLFFSGEHFKLRLYNGRPRQYVVRLPSYLLTEKQP
ncbi:hypothetical protein M23134_04151 [Microscilla marina ATCC 23134]|uniref:Uncharacterized protein n=1 Tax=Microscilla marina ATCC 23134 TaxID=313606 RepID=A1ZE10_MICM2|nr:hypothetical protein M23134_04151 [Microscilla marina ATCC 23134]